MTKQLDLFDEALPGERPELDRPSPDVSLPACIAKARRSGDEPLPEGRPVIPASHHSLEPYVCRGAHTGPHRNQSNQILAAPIGVGTPRRNTLREHQRDEAIEKLQKTTSLTSAEQNWHSKKCEADERHRACIEALPEWCEWMNEREAPKDAEVFRSIVRAHRRMPDPAAMLCILRNSTQPVNERHRTALLRWARALYDREMAYCYAAVTAMVDDTENNYSDPVRSKAVQDDYDDAQCERMDAEDIVYSVVNATISQEKKS